MPHLQELARDAGQLISRRSLEAARTVPEVMGQMMEQMVEIPSKVKRDPSSATTSSAATSTCAKGSKSSGCDKYFTTSSLAMPIALATIIPVCCALVVFFFLHRRHLRKLREEEKNDKHKSLDFGMDEVTGKRIKRKKGERVPEMSIQETQQRLRRGRGMSMDLSTSNPYLLPPGLQSSRESLHSLSRSLNTDDRYRPATIFQPNDPLSPSYPPSVRGDDSSSVTGGSSRRGFPMNESRQNLLHSTNRNSRSMSRSMPPTTRNSVDSPVNSPLGTVSNAQPPVLQKPLPAQHERTSPVDQDPSRARYLGGNKPGASSQAPPAANQNGTAAATGPVNVFADPIEKTLPPLVDETPARIQSPPRNQSPPRGLPSNPRPNREIEKPSSPPTVSENPVPFPQIQTDDPVPDFDTNFQVESPQEMYPDHEPQFQQRLEQDLGYDINRLTIGVRPLPPDDPNENPEQRANRIRSFYKEYFDDSSRVSRFQPSDYHGEYNAEFSAYDTPIFDPDSGNFVTPTPWAEPINRRAMTPPPRGPPRFRAGPRGNIPSAGSDTLAGRGPRAYSSTSARFGQPGKPKKKAPPPQPLATLPTPAMLKDDTFIPTDFAPPQSYNERQAGARPDSPLGSFRPFSPLRPHKALVSSFDDLAIIPSPHALRKSSTFTSLDFAPPPRFKNSDAGGSDAGSIRSNRSGMSAAHQNAVRNGAFRLSRVPTDQVGTRNEFTAALKPTWDMRK